MHFLREQRRVGELVRAAESRGAPGITGHQEGMGPTRTGT